MMSSNDRRVPVISSLGITTLDNEVLLASPSAERRAVVTWLQSRAEDSAATLLVGIESWGYAWGAAVAARMDVGFAAVRRRTELLSDDSFIVEYETSYRGAKRTLGVEKRSIAANSRVALVDDTVVTGETLDAAIRVIECCAATTVCCLAVLGKRRATLGPAIGSDIALQAFEWYD